MAHPVFLGYQILVTILLVSCKIPAAREKLGTSELQAQISAAADKSCNALHHSQHVVNKGENSVTKTYNDQAKLTTLAASDVPPQKPEIPA